MKKSILIVTSALGYGGAGTLLTNQAIHLKKRGWEIVIISMTIAVGRVKILNDNGVKVYALNNSRSWKGVPGTFRKAFSIIRKYQPSIVHSHTYPANIFSRFLKLFMLRDFKLVNTIHNVNEGGISRYLFYRITKFLPSKVTAISKDAAAKHLKHKATSQNKLTVILNGIHTDDYAPNPQIRKRLRNELVLNDNFVWLAAGRLYEQKDYSNLLSAFKKHLQHYPDSVVLIAGQGPLHRMLESKISEMELDEKVKLLGARDDVPELMSASDAYVMSSAWEGLPMALLEASAMQLPVVSTRVGSVPYIVKNGESGFLCEAKDSDQLEHAMTKLQSKTKEERKQLGVNARSHVVRTFEMERIIDQWEELYSELLAS